MAASSEAPSPAGYRSVQGWRSIFRRRNALFGCLFLLLLTFAAVAPDLVTEVSPNAQNLRARLQPPVWMEGGSWQHPLGTDQLGRDIYARLVNGARVSLMVGAAAVLLAATLGTLLGLLAGYFGGLTDAIIMRVADVFLAFPFLLLAVVFMATLGPSLSNIILVLAITGWVEYARIVRGQILTVRGLEFVTAATALGGRAPRIILRHVLPNVLPTAIVIASLHVGTVIIAEASLTFLGLGVPPSVPTWGTMLANGRELLSRAWWIATLPGVAIVLTVLSANFVGDWLRDVLDPTL